MVMESKKLDFDDVLIVPKWGTVKSREEVNLTNDDTVPIIASNMDGVGTFAMARSLAKHKVQTALTKHYTSEEYIKFYQSETKDVIKQTWYSIGTNKEDYEKFKKVNQTVKLKKVCIDVANGYSKSFIDFIKRFKDENEDIQILAGNVVTPEITERLIHAGVDIVKIGIGPGSVCTTRKMTGIGYPQLSAIIECGQAADESNGKICADGGCKTPGDVAKAFGAGADYVMLGRMLAGHTESGFNSSVVPFYGMSSKEAMTKHAGGVAEYRSSEGKSIEIHNRGPVENTIKEILGGLRSTCSYVGVFNLLELHNNTNFVRV